MWVNMSYMDALGYIYKNIIYRISIYIYIYILDVLEIGLTPKFFTTKNQPWVENFLDIF